MYSSLFVCLAAILTFPPRNIHGRALHALLDDSSKNSANSLFNDNREDFNILRSFLRISNAAELFNQRTTQGVTAFVPNDGAMMQTAKDLGLGASTELEAHNNIFVHFSSQYKDPIDALQKLISYHVFLKLVRFSDGPSTDLDSLLGAHGILRNESTLIDANPYLPDARVIPGEQNILAANGIIHVIDRVLINDIIVFDPSEESEVEDPSPLSLTVETTPEMETQEALPELSYETGTIQQQFSGASPEAKRQQASQSALEQGLMETSPDADVQEVTANPPKNSFVEALVASLEELSEEFSNDPSEESESFRPQQTKTSPILTLPQAFQSDSEQDLHATPSIGVQTDLASTQNIGPTMAAELTVLQGSFLDEQSTPLLDKVDGEQSLTATPGNSEPDPLLELPSPESFEFTSKPSLPTDSVSISPSPLPMPVPPEAFKEITVLETPDITDAFSAPFVPVSDNQSGFVPDNPSIVVSTDSPTPLVAPVVPSTSIESLSDFEESVWPDALPLDEEKRGTSEVLEDDEGDGCFPSSAIVHLHNGTDVRLANINAGHVLRASEVKASPVYLFTHRNNTGLRDFVRIVSTKGHVLLLTHGHYLYANHALIPAGQIHIGDELRTLDGPAQVKHISMAQAYGLIAPHTLFGDIVVNRVVTSTYTTAIHPRYAHALLWPLRALVHLGMAKEPLGSLLYNGKPSLNHTLVRLLDS